MKHEVLILSKTKMGENLACVGGLCANGQYVRLLDIDGYNQPADTDLNPRQVWEIDLDKVEDCLPPHVEDVQVQDYKFKALINPGTTVRSILEKLNIPIWMGSPDNLFDGLIKWTDSGSGYIDEGGVPRHSVGFWICNKGLKRDDYMEAVKYSSRWPNGWRRFKHKGFETPVDLIPAGTLVRVSLARWWQRENDETRKCWLQLSGWYDLGIN